MKATALAVIGLAALAGASCREGEVAPSQRLTTEAGAEERVADQIIQSGTHVVTREGVKKALLEARRIAFFNAEARVEADTMEVTFFDANGAPTSRLRALSGRIDQRTNDMVARGGVVVTAEDGTRIEGEELRYDAARDRILSDQPVVITQEGNRIRSQGVEADPALSNIRMTGSSAVLRSQPRVQRRRAASAPPPQPSGAAVAPAGGAPPAGAPSPGEAPPSTTPGPPGAAPPVDGPPVETETAPAGPPAAPPAAPPPDAPAPEPEGA